LWKHLPGRPPSTCSVDCETPPRARGSRSLQASKYSRVGSSVLLFIRHQFSAILAIRGGVSEEHNKPFAVARLHHAAIQFQPILFGYVVLREWRSERAALIACGLVWILAGPTIFGCALWLFGSLRRNLLALRIGGTAIVLSGAVLATVAATGVLPCSAPG